MSRSVRPVDIAVAVPFRVDSIVPVVAPAGSEGPWHSYVITQGTNTITGVRSGTRDQVGVLLDEMVERLNERRLGKHRPRVRSS